MKKENLLYKVNIIQIRRYQIKYCQIQQTEIYMKSNQTDPSYMTVCLKNLQSPRYAVSIRQSLNQTSFSVIERCNGDCWISIMNLQNQNQELMKEKEQLQKKIQLTLQESHNISQVSKKLQLKVDESKKMQQIGITNNQKKEEKWQSKKFLNETEQKFNQQMVKVNKYKLKGNNEHLNILLLVEKKQLLEEIQKIRQQSQNKDIEIMQLKKVNTETNDTIKAKDEIINRLKEQIQKQKLFKIQRQMADKPINEFNLPSSLKARFKKQSEASIEYTHKQDNISGDINSSSAHSINNLQAKTKLIQKSQFMKKILLQIHKKMYKYQVDNKQYHLKQKTLKKQNEELSKMNKQLQANIIHLNGKLQSYELLIDKQHKELTKLIGQHNQQMECYIQMKSKQLQKKYSPYINDYDSLMLQYQNLKIQSEKKIQRLQEDVVAMQKNNQNTKMGSSIFRSDTSIKYSNIFPQDTTNGVSFQFSPKNSPTLINLLNKEKVQIKSQNNQINQYKKTENQQQFLSLLKQAEENHKQYNNKQQNNKDKLHSEEQVSKSNHHKRQNGVNYLPKNIFVESNHLPRAKNNILAKFPCLVSQIKHNNCQNRPNKIRSNNITPEKHFLIKSQQNIQSLYSTRHQRIMVKINGKPIPSRINGQNI